MKKKKTFEMGGYRVLKDNIPSTFQGLNFRIQGLFEWGQMNLLMFKLNVIINIFFCYRQLWVLIQISKNVFIWGVPEDRALPEEIGASSIKKIWGNLNNLRR